MSFGSGAWAREPILSEWAMQQQMIILFGVRRSAIGREGSTLSRNSAAAAWPLPGPPQHPSQFDIPGGPPDENWSGFMLRGGRR